MAMKIAIIATHGPTGSNNWPIIHGKTIDPQLEPTKNKLVTPPVMCSRLSAKEEHGGENRSHGKTDTKSADPDHGLRIRPKHDQAHTHQHADHIYKQD